MSLFYSPSRNAFFDDAISKLPPDAKPISVQDHEYLMQQQAQGMAIAPGPDGNPKAIPPNPSPANPQTVAQALLDKSDITILRCMEKGVAIPDAWISYRDQLRAVVKGQQSTLPGTPAYPAGS